MKDKRLQEGFDRCSHCKKDFHISDPATFTFENGSIICRDCFLLVYTTTSWGAGRERKIIFDYVKVSIPHKLKWKIWRRDGFKCKQCGSDENLAIDHIHPESLGGELVEENLQTLCRTCNARKSNKI